MANVSGGVGAGSTLPVVALMLNALIWGVSWWPLRELDRAGLHPLWATFFIFAISLVGLLIVKPRCLQSLRQFPLLCLLALVTGLTNVCFNWAVAVGDVVRVVLLFYLMPAWVVLLAWPFLGEKPGAASLLRLLLAMTGVIVVLKTPASPWPVPDGLADWLALFGGMTFALTNILLKKLNHTPELGRMAAMFGGGAAVPLVAALALTSIGQIGQIPSPQWSWLGLAFMTSLAFLFGNIALQYGAARLTASATALIMLTELIFASASSVMLDAGTLTLRSLAGGALILLAALWASWPSKPHQAPQPNA